MFIEIVLAILIGTIIGIFTGLIPGLHINLICALLMPFSYLFDRYWLSEFIISAAMAQVFSANLHSIFLGAPEESTALSILPGHRMLIRGEGLIALKIVLIGCLLGTIISIALFPLFLLAMKLYTASYLIYFLLFIALLMIFRDKNKTWALITFLCSGILGLIVFNYATVNEPMLPMLSGLFGLSTMIISIQRKEHVPKQKNTVIKIEARKYWNVLVFGQASGFLTALFPGLSSGMGATISSQLTKFDDKGFLMITGVISAANLVLSLGTLQVLGKARNGSVVAIQQMLTANTDNIFLLLVVLLATAIASFYLVLLVGRIYCRFVERVNYTTTSLFVIGILAILVAVLDGWQGLAILFFSTLIGITASRLGVSRINCMGCIILPVIINLGKF